MRCHPVRWLWGLIPVGILAWVVVLIEKGRIEADLHLRAQDALAQAGHIWAYTVFDGRDAILSGQSWNRKETARAIETVRNVWGVRTVIDRTGPVAIVDNYLWGAFLEPGELILKGFVPNEAMRKAVIGFARAAFPKRSVTDEMQIAGGAPTQTLWLSSVSFSFDQLRRMYRGMAYLDGAALTIAGEAANTLAFRNIESALDGGMPPGLRLENSKILAPAITPFRWEAKLSASELVISGYISDQTVKYNLQELAKDSFPVVALVDRSDVASGAPPGWSAAATVLLAQLARLENGTAVLTENRIEVTGTAANRATADSVRAIVKRGIHKRFKVSANITVTKTPTETVTPFVTAISAAPGRLNVEGYAPGREAHASLYRWLRNHLPGRTVTDTVRIAEGAPGIWSSCLGAGIAALGKLGAGEVRLTGNKLEIVAGTANRALAESLPAEVRAMAAPSCELDVRIRAVTKERPPANPRPAIPGAAEETGSPPPASAGPAERPRGSAARADLQPGSVEDAGRAETPGLPSPVAGARPVRTELSPAAPVDPAMAGPDGKEGGNGQTGTRQAAEPASPAPPETPAPPMPGSPPVPPAQVLTSVESWSRVTAAAPGGAAQQACRKSLEKLPVEAIRFKRASAKLSPAGKHILDKVAKFAKSCPEARIEIEGHTDSEGAPERNLRLSQARADAAVSWLVEAGVDAGRVRAKGHGAERPAMPNDSAEKRALNRRIEFSIRME